MRLAWIDLGGVVARLLTAKHGELNDPIKHRFRMVRAKVGIDEFRPLFFPENTASDLRALFTSFFSGRPNYQPEIDDEKATAWYANENTGVHFNFEWSQGDEDEDPPGPPMRTHAAFNMNLFRPGYLALEASTELNAFAPRLFPFALKGDPAKRQSIPASPLPQPPSSLSPAREIRRSRWT